MTQEMQRNGDTDTRQGQTSSSSSEGGQLPAIPLAEGQPVDRATALVAALVRAGTLVLSPEEQARLTARFPESAVLVRKLRDRSERYLPHIEISRRLSEALGVGQWCLVRLREWYDQDTSTVYGSYALVVRGVWVGDTVAGWPYRRANSSIDYADALECCRGVALRRIAAKSLGCGDQVWEAEGGAPSTKAATNSPPRPQSDSQSVPPVPADRLAALRLLGDQHADGGLCRLRAWWETLSKGERIALGGKLSAWKQRAEASDTVFQQAERSGTVIVR